LKLSLSKVDKVEEDRRKRMEVELQEKREVK
jgi:hypothetical protein